jgi:hypothetical protein
MQHSVPTAASCTWSDSTYPYTGHIAPIYIDYPYFTEDDLFPKTPLHTYDPSTDTARSVYGTQAPAAPDPAVAVPKIANSLNDPTKTLLQSENKYALDPSPDPSEQPIEAGIDPTTDRNNRCRASRPRTSGQRI